MKLIPLLAATLALLTLEAPAQQPERARPTGQVTIRATAKNGRPEKKDRDAKDKDTAPELTIKNLEISLSGAKSVTGALKLVTTFYARDLGKRDTVVENAADSEVTLDANLEAKISTPPVTFTSTPAHTAKVDGKNVKVDASGHTYYGWVVRVYQGEILMGELASAPPLLKL